MMKRILPGALICIFLFLWVCVAPVTLGIAMQPSIERQLAEGTATASAGRTAQAQLRNMAEPTTIVQSAPLVTSPVPVAVPPTSTPDPAAVANARAKEGGDLFFLLLAIAIIGSYVMTTGNRQWG